MKVIVKILESKEGFKGPVDNVCYLKNLHGALTDKKDEAVVIRNEADLDVAKKLAAIFCNCFKGTPTWFSVQPVIDQDYVCQVRVIAETETGNVTHIFNVTSEDLKNDYPEVGEDDYYTIEDYCADLIYTKYQNSDCGASMLHIEYSEDNGITWKNYCKNLLLI